MANNPPALDCFSLFSDRPQSTHQSQATNLSILAESPQNEMPPKRKSSTEQEEEAEAVDKQPIYEHKESIEDSQDSEQDADGEPR